MTQSDLNSYEELELLASSRHLEILGSCYADQADPVPEGTKTIILLGPKEPGFWDHVSSQEEFHDDRGHPLDRWSARVIGGLARQLGATAVFPFGGPPYMPFMGWALRTGRCWHSPVMLLVHDTSGMMVSFRGAICFRYKLRLSLPAGRSPCATCLDQPCRTACPIRVLTENGFDANGCRGYIASPEGSDCLDRGCQVRRACPVSKRYDRKPQQSRFHQLAFLQRK